MAGRKSAYGTALVTRLNEAENSVISAQHSLLSAVINASNAKAQLEAAVYAFSDRDMAEDAAAESSGAGETVASVTEDKPEEGAPADNEGAEEPAGNKPAAVPADQQPQGN